MKELIMLAGLPGSGKSTWAKEYKNRMTGADRNAVQIVSTDEIRKELWGDAADQQNGAKVFEVAYQRIEFWLSSPYCDTVIFDATNLHKKDRKRFLNKFGIMADTKLVWFDTPYTECVRRNFQRERNVPTAVIQRMFEHMDVPTLDEGFDEYTVVY